MGLFLTQVRGYFAPNGYGFMTMAGTYGMVLGLVWIAFSGSQTDPRAPRRRTAVSGRRLVHDETRLAVGVSRRRLRPFSGLLLLIGSVPSCPTASGIHYNRKTKCTQGGTPHSSVVAIGDAPLELPMAENGLPSHQQQETARRFSMCIFSGLFGNGEQSKSNGHKPIGSLYPYPRIIPFLMNYEYV